MIYDYDVIVVGAGSSGLMAAINAAQQGARVLVIDKNPKPGRKLLLSGGGRCNVTNRTSREKLIAHIPGNGKFLYSALNQFDQEDIINYFESRGVELKEEDHGRMFPVTNKARTILETLLSELAALAVPIRLKNPVAGLVFDKDHPAIRGIKTEAGETITAKAVILAVGGCAYPRTGTTGDGYGWAKAAGHTISRLYPTEAPLLSHDPFIRDASLKGVSLRDVNVIVWKDQPNQSQQIVNHQMDMIFTHQGYSGPAILRCSGHVNQLLHEEHLTSCHLTIDIQPNRELESLRDEAEAARDKQVLTIMKLWMPERLAQVVLKCLNIDGQLAFKQLEHGQVDHLLAMVKAFPITAYDSEPIEKGFVTGGGVSTKEVNPKTMESKLMPGLFFCGELLDINGYTGGYNITAAFVTGTVAGQHAAWSSLE